MRIVIDDDTVQLIDEVRNYCKDCENPCTHPYKKRADVIKAAMTKFSELDCIPEGDDEE